MFQEAEAQENHRGTEDLPERNLPGFRSSSSMSFVIPQPVPSVASLPDIVAVAAVS